MSKGRDLKPHIGIFGRRNNGKSSVINILTGQETAIVSDIPGTTTDPVKKSIELEGIGPAIIIDTAGIDDTGDLGSKRMNKSREVLKIIDLAILVIANNSFNEFETNLIDGFTMNDVPFFILHNKSDEVKLDPILETNLIEKYKVAVIDFSVKDGNPDDVIQNIRKHIPETAFLKRPMIGDIISSGDTVLLITPIDLEAPEGRMILPQMQVIRDILDNDGIAVVCKENEVEEYVKKMSPKPTLVITDSQVFPKADAAIPKDIRLTSFSIVLARQRGDFINYLKGTPHLSELKTGDRVLILESCTHHVSCDDIGRFKIPDWLNKYTGSELEYDTVPGLSAIPRPITDYAMVIQCGGCMITSKQIINRLKPAVDAGIPVTNYGMAIAYIHGIYNRAIAPFVNS